MPVTVAQTESKAAAEPSRAPVVPLAVTPANQSFKATFVAATSDSVTVEGVGTIQGTPDVVVLGLQASVTRDTSSDAMNAANAAVAKVIASLRHRGVAAADIQSTGLSLYPTYSYRENEPPTLTGYQAGQSLNAKLRSAKKRGATISAVSEASPGDVQITGLSFDLDNDSALLTKAQRAAFQAAKKKAAEYARLSGRSLGRVMTVNETTTPQAGPGPIPFASGAGAAAAPVSDVPIATGSQAVGVSVVVTWALR